MFYDIGNRFDANKNRSLLFLMRCNVLHPKRSDDWKTRLISFVQCSNILYHNISHGLDRFQTVKISLMISCAHVRTGSKIMVRTIMNRNVKTIKNDWTVRLHKRPNSFPSHWNFFFFFFGILKILEIKIFSIKKN